MVLKKLILIHVFFLCGFLTKAQEIGKFKDSITAIIKKAPSDSVKASVYYDAASLAIRKFGDLNQFGIYNDSTIYYARASGHKKLEAQSHFAYGLQHRLSGHYEVALKHLDTNLRYFKNDSVYAPYALFQVAVIHKELGDKKKSLKTYIKILKIFEAKKDSFAIASTLNSIARVYGEMKNYDEAISNFNSAATLFEQLNVQRDVSNTYRNIADIYLLLKDTLKSRRFAQKSLEIAREIKFDQAIGWALYSLGKTYLKSDPNRTLAYYEEAKPIVDTSGFNNLSIFLYMGYGEYYVNMNQQTKAISYYKKALELAESTKSLSEAKEIYGKLATIFATQKNFTEAYTYQNNYVKANDSLINQENLKTINLLQKQFETEKKDKEIAQQQLTLETQEIELQKKKTQYSIMTGIAIFLLVSSLLGWFLYQQRQKRKNQEILTLKREQQVKTLESLMEGEEKERFRIAKELHDGVNGDLSAIKYKLSSMLEHNAVVVDEIVAMIDKSSEQVRAISHNLVPPSLEKFNLVEALEDYCSTTNDVHESNITYQHIGEEIHISKNNEINIYRIVQELVSNCIKHSGADEITVQTSHRENNIQITVEDNGKGFDPSSIDSKGIGLKNIDSRINYLNATKDMVSNSNGTSYTIEIDIIKLNDN